jgi:hypothetical protein
MICKSLSVGDITPGIPKYPFYMTYICYMSELYVQEYLKASKQQHGPIYVYVGLLIVSSGRICAAQAGI